MVKRIYTSLQVILLVSAGLSAIMIFSYAFFYLQAQGRTESKIEENVVLRFNQPTEYIEGNSFWWLLEGSNAISMVNFSNEMHTGLISIELTQNPCSNFQTAKFSNQVIDFDKKDDRMIVQEVFSIGPYEKKSFELQILNSQKCMVDTGDSREFGAKLVSWYIQ
jgi:hypothetical protein